MKITKVETLEIDLSGQNGIALWRPIFARIHTDEGITGLGEAALAFGTASEAVGPMIVKLAERFVLGHDPNDTETLWEHMLRQSFWAQGGGPVIFGAMSALDAALWDIKGKAAGLPVHRLLGAKTPEPLRCYASQLHFGWEAEHRMHDDPAEYRETAQKVREEGYGCVKLCPLYVAAGGGRARHRGLLTPQNRKLAKARMEAIREGVGSDVDVIIELNGPTSTASALQIADMFADFGVLFIEEPTHYNSPEAHLKVAARSSIPMATGLPALSAGRRHFRRHEDRASRACLRRRGSGVCLRLAALLGGRASIRSGHPEFRDPRAPTPLRSSPAIATCSRKTSNRSTAGWWCRLNRASG